MSKRSEPPKETIGSRIPPDWMQRIDEVCAEAGINRSEWLLSVIGEALGKTDVNVVHGLIERVTALEKAEQVSQLEQQLTALTQQLEELRAIASTRAQTERSYNQPSQDAPQRAIAPTPVQSDVGAAITPSTASGVELHGVCPHCGSEGFTSQGYRTGNGVRYQRRSCKSCGQSYKGVSPVS